MKTLEVTMSKEREEKKWWRDFGVGQLVIDTLTNNKGKEIIIFDTETTGLSAETCHVIQLSALKCIVEDNCQLREIGRLDTYINPGYQLPKKITEITGITDEHLAKFPNETTQWPSICEFFEDVPIICGHNVPFDIGFMKAMYQRQTKEKWDPIALDTLKMAQELHRKSEAGSHKLGVLAEHFGLDYGLTFHNSMDDVIATTRLLRLFVEEYQEKKETLGNEPAPQKVQTKVKNCWTYTGYRGMQRLYVKVWHENRVIWMNQRRPYEWGEKDKGSIDIFDMKDIEQQVLKLYGCETLEELSKVRESKYAK